MYFPSPCEFIAVSVIVFVETGAAGSHVLLQICHCCESPGAANEGMDVVSKISWTHLRHRCCLSQIGVACCLFGCTWSRGFCHSLGLLVLSCTVCLALCVCRPCRLACLFPLSFPFPPTLAYFCWLLSPGCSLGPRHRSLWLPPHPIYLGGRLGTSDGGDSPQPNLSYLAYTVYTCSRHQ